MTAGWSPVSVEVFTWLGLRRQQAEDLAGQAAQLAQQVQRLADSLAGLAHAHARLTRAVDATLRAHQPDPSGLCVRDREPWPCHTVRVNAEALRPPKPAAPPPDQADTQQLPRIPPDLPQRRPRRDPP